MLFEFVTVELSSGSPVVDVAVNDMILISFVIVKVLLSELTSLSK